MTIFLALEQEGGSDDTGDTEQQHDLIEVVGPLSQVFAKALALVFNKEKLNVATESQANDAIMMQVLSRASKTALEPLNIELSTLPSSDKKMAYAADFEVSGVDGVLYDPNFSNMPSGSIVALENYKDNMYIKAICQSKGFKLVPSLENFIYEAKKYHRSLWV